MRWQCRLEGGPYDGDSGTWDYPSLPELLYIYRCPNCRDIHWTPNSDDAEKSPTELYMHDRREDIGKGIVEVYVYAHLDLEGLPLIREAVLDAA